MKFLCIYFCQDSLGCKCWKPLLDLDKMSIYCKITQSRSCEEGLTIHEGEGKEWTDTCQKSLTTLSVSVCLSASQSPACCSLYINIIVAVV